MKQARFPGGESAPNLSFSAPARVFTLTLTGGGLSIPIRLNGLSDWPEYVSGENWGNDWEHYSSAGNTEYAHEMHNWTAIWTGLPKYDGEGREIAYTVTETVGWPGFSPVYAIGDTTATSVILTRNGDTYTGELTNRPGPYLRIRKVGAAGDNALAGCEFTLTWTDGAGSHTLTLVSDADGLLTDVNSGTNAFPCDFDTVYTLTETKAVSGYVLLARPIGFVYSSGENRWIVMDDNAPKAILNYTSTLEQANSDLPRDGNAYLAVVANTPGVTLPCTGGTGTVGFYFLGTALLLGAAVLLIKSRYNG